MSALTEALVAAQKELPTAIGRDSQGLGYRYTSLDKLIAETRPILTAHGLAISQWPAYVVVTAAGEMRPVLVTRLDYFAKNGTPEPVRESLEYSMPLYVTEKTMQGYGSAITYARRYAWAAALGIASEEDTDAATLKAEEEIPF